MTLLWVWNWKPSPSTVMNQPDDNDQFLEVTSSLNQREEEDQNIHLPACEQEIIDMWLAAAHSTVVACGTSWRWQVPQKTTRRQKDLSPSDCRWRNIRTAQSSIALADTPYLSAADYVFGSVCTSMQAQDGCTENNKQERFNSIWINVVRAVCNFCICVLISFYLHGADLKRPQVEVSGFKAL